MDRLISVAADEEGIFRERLNKFVARVDINGREELVHVHDPGRLSELLFEGNRVLLKSMPSPNRKTRWDLVAAFFDNRPVFVHSGYHRKIAEAILRDRKLSPIKGVTSFKAEVKLGRSRIDFVVQRDGTPQQVWLEVKGCTLAEDGVALFPDAPTERGRRHLSELREAVKSGVGGAVIFLVFRSDARCFSPNSKTDHKFSDEFWNALRDGVRAYPLLLEYDGNWIYFLREIPLCEQGGR